MNIAVLAFPIALFYIATMAFAHHRCVNRIKAIAERKALVLSKKIESPF